MDGIQFYHLANDISLIQFLFHSWNPYFRYLQPLYQAKIKENIRMDSNAENVSIQWRHHGEEESWDLLHKGCMSPWSIKPNVLFLHNEIIGSGRNFPHAMTNKLSWCVHWLIFYNCVDFWAAYMAPLILVCRGRVSHSPMRSDLVTQQSIKEWRKLGLV